MKARAPFARTALAGLALAGSMAAVVSAAPRGEAPSGSPANEIPLGGRLVAVLAPSEGELLLLVAPEADVDGPRRLLRVSGDRGDRNDRNVEELAHDLGGWTKTLAAVDFGGGRIELVAGGLGRLVSLGALASPTSEPRTLVEHAGFDLRSLAPERLRVGVERELATAEVGALRLWSPREDGSVALAAELDLPFRTERRSSGLRLVGPPVVELPRDAAGGRRFAAGPQAVGKRLRVDLIEQHEGGAWGRTATWCSLPGVEAVEESWLALVDGTPALLAHTQGAAETNIFEDQLWRVWTLAPDVSRGGRAPALAVTVDSKRWHDTEALLADVNGDGRTDAVIARPEGLTGGDLVVEVFAGEEGHRFARRSRRTDVNDAPSSFRLLADSDGRGTPGLASIAKGSLTLQRLERDGSRALERSPFVSASWAVDPPPAEDVEGASRWTRTEWLGAVPRAGRPPLLLLVRNPDKGADRLLIVDSPSR